MFHRFSIDFPYMFHTCSIDFPHIFGGMNIHSFSATIGCLRHQDKVYITPTPPEKIVAAALPEALVSADFEALVEMDLSWDSQWDYPLLVNF